MDSSSLLDLLFISHGCFVVVAGGLGLVYPQVYIHAFSKEADNFAFLLVVRLYSALILGQAVLLYGLKTAAQFHMRRTAARAYTAIFALHALSIFISIPVEKAYEKVTWILWVLGGSFASLSAAYGVFGFAVSGPKSLTDEGSSA
eukprot:gnl/TRDRNA2_/TRDRNA2_44246_c0_seq1.p2 gnl/TRDRNA2_/TRDRNA2_44246_c0~~gnl/TRDRNA2_/TRDRNA2_44246_c0_seq1.p2  ORF type:complete len:145 (+),score=15.54 gnl/TRDRNA2_/TRDRNA2_44246_c0_seq1:47-481(+)